MPTWNIVSLDLDGCGLTMINQENGSISKNNLYENIKKIFTPKADFNILVSFSNRQTPKTDSLNKNQKYNGSGFFTTKHFFDELVSALTVDGIKNIFFCPLFMCDVITEETKYKHHFGRTYRKGFKKANHSQESFRKFSTIVNTERKTQIAYLQFVFFSISFLKTYKKKESKNFMNFYFFDDFPEFLLDAYEAIIEFQRHCLPINFKITTFNYSSTESGSGLLDCYLPGGIVKDNSYMNAYRQKHEDDGGAVYTKAKRGKAISKYNIWKIKPKPEEMQMKYLTNAEIKKYVDRTTYLRFGGKDNKTLTPQEKFWEKTIDNESPVTTTTDDVDIKYYRCIGKDLNEFLKRSNETAFYNMLISKDDITANNKLNTKILMQLLSIITDKLSTRRTLTRTGSKYQTFIDIKNSILINGKYLNIQETKIYFDLICLTALTVRNNKSCDTKTRTGKYIIDFLKRLRITNTNTNKDQSIFDNGIYINISDNVTIKRKSKSKIEINRNNLDYSKLRDYILETFKNNDKQPQTELYTKDGYLILNKANDIYPFIKDRMLMPDINKIEEEKKEIEEVKAEEMPPQEE